MALAGGVAVCAGFVPGAGLFVIVGVVFVIGGRVAGQGRRQAVFIQRAGVFCEVNQGHFRRRGYLFCGEVYRLPLDLCQHPGGLAAIVGDGCAL